MAKKPIDLNFDCLCSLFKHIPLEHRVLTLRRVNRQWKAVVEEQCRTQKVLTLQISGRDRLLFRLVLPFLRLISPKNKKKEKRWTAENFSEWIKEENLLVSDAIDAFHSLTVVRLSARLVTFLTSAFPHLHTLAVIADDQQMKTHHQAQSKDATITFLWQLPQLITAYSETLTTLQLVFNVRNGPFLAVFAPLIASIDGLHRLKRLSFYDASAALRVPLFDLPNLLRQHSLATFDFYAYSSPDDFATHWGNSLQARQTQANCCIPLPMQINYFTEYCFFGLQFIDSFALPIFFHNSNNQTAAQHFTAISLYPLTLFALHRFFTHAAAHFTHLNSLWLSLDRGTTGGYNQPEKLDWVLSRLAATLPRLTELSLAFLSQEWPVYANGVNIGALPVLPSVRRLHLTYWSTYALWHCDFEAMHLAAVFPGVRQVWLNWLNVFSCHNCEWKRHDSEMRRVQRPPYYGVEAVLRPVEQCVARLAAPFASSSSSKAEVMFVHFGLMYESVRYRVTLANHGQRSVQVKVTEEECDQRTALPDVVMRSARNLQMQTTFG